MLKELKDFIRYFWKTSNVEKSTVFYSEHEGYYPVFERIINELINKHKQTLCYITSDFNDPILHKSEPGLNTFYINKLLAIFMALVNCKVFVMTLTDLNQFHLKRSVNPVHYIYMFHSPVSTTLAYLPGAFDYYDSILCVGPYQIEEIKQNEQLNNLAPKNLVKAGYCVIEKIAKEYEKYSNNLSINERMTICIAPSWGDGNIIECMGEKLVEFLLNEGYEVIVRPHPETVKRNKHILENLEQLFIENDRFNFDWTVAEIDSLIKSDVLICDLSGVAIEYSFGTLRPVLFLDSKRKVRNENYMELGIEPFELKILKKIGKLVSPRNFSDIIDNVNLLIRDQQKYKSNILKLRDESIYNFGNSSEVIVRYILNANSNARKNL